MSDEQNDNTENPLLVSGANGQIRLKDFVFLMDENGRLVIMPYDKLPFEIFIPGRFTGEDVDVRIDARGLFIRLKKLR